MPSDWSHGRQPDHCRQLTRGPVISTNAASVGRQTGASWPFTLSAVTATPLLPDASMSRVAAECRCAAFILARLNPRCAVSRLRMCTTGLANALQRVCGRGCMTVGQRHVAQGQDTDQPLLAVDDGKPSDLVGIHVLGNVIDFLVVEAVAKV